MKCWWKFLSQTIFLHFRTSNLDKYKRKGKSIWLMEKMKKHPVYANIPSSRHLDHNVYFNRCKVNEKKNIVFFACNISKLLIFLLILYMQSWACWHYSWVDRLLAYSVWLRIYAKLSQRHRAEITSLKSREHLRWARCFYKVSRFQIKIIILCGIFSLLFHIQDPTFLPS